jgi:GNAT superfamily N-acetyltransferase
VEVAKNSDGCHSAVPFGLVRIEYRTAPTGLRVDQIDGFFVGWPARPAATTLLAHLGASYRCAIAVDAGSDHVVGFATAISDGVLAASIPLLEVLPGWHRRGIGTELMHLLLDQLTHLYAVDLSCDAELAPFYERFGFSPATAMVQRRVGSIGPLA